MIHTKNLKMVFTTEDVETTALNDVDIRVEEGEFVAVMGPSGCGKSTLLNLLGLLDSPSGGTYLFLGEDVTSCSERQRARLRKANIGFVFQSFNLIDELTVAENVELPLLYQRVPAARRREQVMRTLEELEIAHRARHYPQQLSGGQQQRAAVARAVVAEPMLILADEPTGNLDSAHGLEVMGLLANLNAAGTTIVMVTHDSSYAEFGSRIIHLFDGAVVSQAPILPARPEPAPAMAAKV